VLDGGVDAGARPVYPGTVAGVAGGDGVGGTGGGPAGDRGGGVNGAGVNGAEAGCSPA
jgi:hypothetical protein